jgi:glycosyltransferase involved in cell wall biosynthesis
VTVSVVIPAHDSASWLADALAGVAAQSLPADEVIVVDDGSTDGTAELAESLGARCLRQPRAGSAAARNLGIRECRGELIALLDADDVWTPDKLELQVPYMRDHPELLYTITRFRHFHAGGSLEGIRKDVLEGDHIGWLPSALVARRAAFDVVGLFDESMSSDMDVDWFARATDLGAPMEILPQVLLLKRARADSVTWSTGHANLFMALRRSVARKREVEDTP